MAVAALVLALGLGITSCTSASPAAQSGPTATVPNVNGETVAQAVRKLTGAGFVPRDSGLSPDDVVVSTRPAAGTYSGGDPYISLEVTTPTTTTTVPPAIAVPDVEGKTVADAASIMAAAGFTLDSSAVYPDSVIAYTVPGAGTPAPRGAVVQDYSCAAGYQPFMDNSGRWSCNPGDLAPNWGGQ